MQDSRRADAETRFDAVEKDAEIERLPIVVRHAARCRCAAPRREQRSKSGRSGSGAVARMSMPQYCSNASATLVSRHGRRASAVRPRQAKRRGAGRRLAGAQQALAIGDQVAPRGAGPIPFEHREFGVVGGAALAVAKHMGELPDPRQARDQQLFHREFRRGVEIAPQRRGRRADRAIRWRRPADAVRGRGSPAGPGCRPRQNRAPQKNRAPPPSIRPRCSSRSRRPAKRSGRHHSCIRYRPPACRGPAAC